MSPDDEDDLIGFRDFIDGEDNKPAKSTRRRRESTNTSFELLTFFENESNRLDMQNKFFEEKVYMIKNFPQAQSIRVHLSDEIQTNIKLLDKMLLKKDSSLFKSLNEILKQFKK